MQIKLKGINPVRKRLANGTVQTFYYLRSTGARLPDDPRSPEFQRAYADATATAPNDTGTVASLIRTYLKSPRFEKKAASTQREYKRMLTKLEAEVGTMKLKALRSPKVRGEFIELQDKIARENGEREADNRLTVLSAVFTFAAVRGLIADNPIRGFERLHDGDRSEFVWTEADIARFMDGDGEKIGVAPLELQQAMILGLHTGQRPGDLVRVRWSDYDGASVTLKQSKTGKRIRVKASATLKVMLNGMTRHGPYILTRPPSERFDTHRPWFTKGNDKELGKTFIARAREVGIAKLEFGDLRGTTVTLLAEAGCSVPEICSITGHTLQSAQRILDRHYLKRTPVLAASAVERFENASATNFANQLQTKGTETERPKRKTKAISKS